MALTFNHSTEESIELADFLSFLREYIDYRDFESVCSSSEMLKKLSNNKVFIPKILNSQLLNMLGDDFTFYTNQSAVLASEGRFAVRLNTWPVLSADSRRAKIQAQQYSYHDAHDHNFAFVTVGYYGSGYMTKIYEYDRSKVKGYIGEPVNLQFLEETTLPAGKVMAYRPFADIHSQLPPIDFSMSLNVLVSDPLSSLTEQYYFDLDHQTISGYVESLSARRVSVIEALGIVGDDESVGLLLDLGRKHQCVRTRMAALQTALLLKPSMSEYIVSIAHADDNGRVRLAFENSVLLGGL